MYTEREREEYFDEGMFTMVRLSGRMFFMFMCVCVKGLLNCNALITCIVLLHEILLSVVLSSYTEMSTVIYHCMIVTGHERVWFVS